MDINNRINLAISSNYFTVSYKSNKNVEKATIIVTFKGNYTGQLKKTFKILPRKTSIKNMDITPVSAKVSWTKQKKQITGYEIQVSTAKSFSDKTTMSKKVKSATTDSITIKNLKPNKNYYIRIRTYKEVGDKKYYSGWSGSKKFDTKGYSKISVYG